MNRYLLEHRVGADANGELFLATLRRPDRSEKRVLVKCVPAAEGSPDSPPADLLREHITSCALHHSCIVQTFDAGRHGDIYFLVSEYTNGPDLEDLFERCRQRGMSLPIDLVIYIGRQLAAALSQAHDQPYPPPGGTTYHGSLCPAKVHLSVFGTVKLRGFGAAPAEVAYQCPEQLVATAGSTPGDLFSLGILLFEALCGEVPFDGSTEHEVRESLRNGRSRPPRSLRPEVPQELDQLVARCLQPDPTQRYLAAGELRRDLERLAHYRQASAGSGLLTDFIAASFPERNHASVREPIAPGASPPWEELSHRLSPLLVELPRSMEAGRSSQIRLIRPDAESSRTEPAGPAEPAAELPRG